MLNLKLNEIASLCGGTLNDSKFGDTNIDLVSIDTRTIEQDDMYMPIIGEKFDGHVFIDEAFNKGAAATFSKYGEYDNPNNKPIIWVNNTNQAFIDLATNYVKSLDKLKIIAITGSNGKTTTKDLISSVLEKDLIVKKTIGNLNNHIGVPRTLLRFNKHTDVGVVEMGTDGFGQIEVLSNMAKPDIAIITNIGDSHLEQLKTKENIAEEKLHIIDGLKEDGIFIYNNDDDILREKVKSINIKQKTISFGTREDSDFVIKIIESNKNGSVFNINGYVFNIPLIGSHQILNSTIAIIIGRLFDVNRQTIIDALGKKEITKMRSELIPCKGFDILNDSYKSNPQSLRSALETANLLTGYSRKIAILGDMLELGDNEVELHKEIGREISPENVDYLLLYGKLSKNIYDEAIKHFDGNRVFYFDTKDKLIDKAKFLITKNSLVLVKASRSMRMEEIIEVLNHINL
ncbi:UDP-N-acetylmuramoyl-tripeptide--D-alanyl-D-alanine ligase [Helcococcus bovis]|uniref:UDP-N-acetylmuramoyl-tripeptide--D-alanyl-D-alanine ligase n=1 Tax=Helcococcus bovis TaxID=3153252 RepID=A0ABW9F4W8_9FIRM